MADLEESGLKLVTEGADKFESDLRGANDAFESFGNIAGSVSGLVEGASEIIGGALSAVADIALGALASAGSAVTDFFADSFSGALEAETNMARFDAVLRAVTVSSEEQAAAFANASGQTVTSTRLSADAIEELQDELTHASAKLNDMEAAYLNLENPTETQTLKLQDQRATVAELQSAIESGAQVISTDLADAMGLIPPIAHLTREELLDLADEYKNLAGGSDDAVIAAESVLLKFTQISRDTFPEALEVSADLAAFLGVDMASAAQTLGFALDNPGEALARLNKQTGAFTDAEIETIKKMAEAGDTAGAQALILENLTNTVGGTAAALAATTEGQWTIFKETIADAGETVLGVLLPPLNALMQDILTPLIPIIESVASSIGTFIETIIGGGDISTAFDNLAGAIYRVFGPEVGLAVMQFGDFVTGLVATVQENLPLAQAKFDEVMTAIQPVIDASMNLASAFSDSMPMIQGTVQVMADFVIAQFNNLSPTLIANVSSTLDSIATFWREHGDEIMAVVTLAFEFITVTIGSTLTLISGLIASGLALINGDTDAAMSILQNTFTTVMDSILSIVGTDLETFTSDWRGTFDLLKTIIDQSLVNISDAITTAIADIITGLFTLANDFLEIGQAFIDNIATGITDSISGLINAARDAAAQAYAAILDELGIHSPSQLLMDVGAVIDDSLALGMMKNIRAVIEAADTVGRAALVHPPMSAAQIGAQYAYNSTDARQYNLNVSTDKRMSTIATEFATMQVLAGLT